MKEPLCSQWKYYTFLGLILNMTVTKPKIMFEQLYYKIKRYLFFVNLTTMFQRTANPSHHRRTYSYWWGKNDVGEPICPIFFLFLLASTAFECMQVPLFAFGAVEIRRLALTSVVFLFFVSFGRVWSGGLASHPLTRRASVWSSRRGGLPQQRNLPRFCSGLDLHYSFHRGHGHQRLGRANEG